MSVSAETVTLFDAAALGCDGSRLYMGGDWSGKTVYNLPADAEQLKSSEEAFVNGNKELRIYSDAFNSASADGKFVFTFGWVGSTGQFQLALGATTDSKENNIVDYVDVNSYANSTFTVNMSDFDGTKWNQQTSMSAQEAADKLKAAGYITLHGHNYDIVKVEYEYTPEGGDVETTFSGSKEIKNLTFAFGENWYDVAKNGADASKALWIKPKYMPNVQAGDEIHITFESDGGQANFVYLDSDNNWQKRGDNNSVSPDWIDVISKSHTYVFKITSATLAEEMAANGLWVDGKQNTVAKVVFVYNKHAEDIEGDIVADGGEDPQPPVEENFTSRVLWQTGDQILSAKGETTSIVFDSNWMSRYGLQDGDADRLDQAFHIPAEKFFTSDADATNADLDDCIVVTYKEANPGAQASFYFQDPLDEDVWFKRGCGDANTVVDSYAVDGTVFYRYLLNYRMVAALRHNGLWIDGNNGSEIVKVELRNYSNEALDDSFPYFTGKTKQDIDPSKADRGYVVDDEGDNRSFGYDNLKRVRPVAFTNYNNGERIILTFRPVAENAELRLQYIRPYSANLKVAQALTGTDSGILTIGTPGEDGLVDVVYRPTQREIRALKFNGLFLDGNGLELVEISFGEEDPGDMQNDIYVHNDWMTLGHDGEDGKIYEGDSYSSGEVKIYVSNSHFQRAKENNWLGMENGEYKGYKLTFHFPWSGGAWLNLYYDANNIADQNRDPLNWYYESAYGSGMPKAAPFRAPEDEPSATGTYYNINDIPAGENVYYDQHLSHDDVEKLLNYGMWIEGGNADMQSVRLRSRLSVSGVESAVEDDLTDSVIDLNLPYEAYTLDGRRVADIEAAGIYIVRQGSKVVKMIRR